MPRRITRTVSRVFSLDSHEELDKIVEETSVDGVAATDLTLCVRLRVSSAHAKLSLGSKFGVGVADAPPLLMAARQAADALGICFHVGSQCMSPQAYSDALAMVRAAIVGAGVTVDVIDVGGGFPSVYPGSEAPSLDAYFAVIHRAFEALPVSYSAELWAEPGRALCAEYASVLVRVEARRGDVLHLNDGAYGSLFDAAHIDWKFPVALVRDTPSRAKDMGFSFYGPTCDDMDFMRGPWELPADIQTGDYVEIGMLGAYGSGDADRLQRLHCDSRRRGARRADDDGVRCHGSATRQGYSAPGRFRHNSTRSFPVRRWMVQPRAAFQALSLS